MLGHSSLSEEPVSSLTAASAATSSAVGTSVIAQPNAAHYKQRGQTTFLGNATLALILAASSTAPMMRTPMSAPQQSRVVQQPQLFAGFRIYEEAAYVPVATRVTAQPRVLSTTYAQTMPTASFRFTQEEYFPASLNVHAQANYPHLSIRYSGFAQRAQIELYQPVAHYLPPQSAHFDNPILPDYSITYQGFAQSADLNLYTTEVVAGTDDYIVRQRHRRSRR